MYKNVLVFYSSLPISGVYKKNEIGTAIKNEVLASKLERAIINDMLSEYNPFLEDEYDLVFYYEGNLDEFRIRHKYNVKRYIRVLSQDLKIGLTHIHNILAENYENIIIVFNDSPLLTKSQIKNCFKKFDENFDCVVIPNQNKGISLFGSFGYFENYFLIDDFKNNSFDKLQKIIQEEEQKSFECEEAFIVNNIQDIKTLYQKITENNYLKPEFYYLSKTFAILEKHKADFII